MIYFRNINDIEDYSGKEIWLIMRSVTGNLEKIAKLPNVHVVPELAPSEKLYTDFLLWKKKLDWGQEKFDNEYTPRFIYQLSTDKKAQLKLLELCKRKDNSIYLCCACEREQMCHRIIIARLLDQWGIPIDVENVMHLKRQP